MGRPSLVSVFERGVSLRSYMHVRRRHHLTFPGWKADGYSTDGKAWYYANKKFDWKVYVKLEPGQYDIGIDAYNGKRHSIGLEFSKDRAEKLARIVIDAVSWDVATGKFSLVDAITDFEKERRERAGGARISVGSARERTSKDEGSEGERLKLGDSYIRELYREVAEQARERFGIKTPRLRVLHGMHSYKGGYLDKSDTIHITNVTTKPDLRITILHELSHAVAQKKYGEDGHGYYFLQVYKVLTGRDYFDNQDELLKKLKH